MRRSRTGLAMGAVLVLLGAACSDRLAAPVELPGLLLPELIVSEARAGNASGNGIAAASLDVAWVALPPGSLPTVTSVRIRNVAGVHAGVTVPVVDGGFDPVPIPAAADDRLELTLTQSTGAVVVAYAPVPRKRPPVVVRTFPTKGRTDVALYTAPTVIFSEPVDELTLPAGVRLFRGDVEVTVAVELAAHPWEARVVPAAPLEPGADHELRITSAVRDLEGDALETPLYVPFTTGSVSLPPVPWGNSRIAFDRPLSDSYIFLGQPLGSIAALRQSGVCSAHHGGYAPRLSPDGTKVLFLLDGMAPVALCVTDLDGSNDRRFDWGLAAWSADGTQILAVEGSIEGAHYRQRLYTFNADGTGGKHLLSESLPPGIRALDVSSDGTLVFGTNGGEIWLLDGEGSGLRRVRSDATLSHADPDWSPDGVRIAYAARDGDGMTIESMVADGSDVRIHFRTDAGEGAYDPEWSPDGRSIAFARTSRGGGGNGIFVVTLESGSVARLVDGDAWSISWAAVKP